MKTGLQNFQARLQRSSCYKFHDALLEFQKDTVEIHMMEDEDDVIYDEYDNQETFENDQTNENIPDQHRNKTKWSVYMSIAYTVKAFVLNLLILIKKL